MKRRSQLGLKGTCPCVGVLCFLVAFVASIFATSDASADAPLVPLTALKGTPLAVPATILGVSNPYLIRAALPEPTVQRFVLSKDIRDLALRFDRLARNGVDLTQRALQPEKLHLRFESRDFGGLLQFCYRH